MVARGKRGYKGSEKGSRGLHRIQGDACIYKGNFSLIGICQ